MNTIAIKAAVRERDGYRCRGCAMTAEAHKAQCGRTLDVHRITPGSPYTVDGCLTLCRACHGPQPRSPRGRPDLADPNRIKLRLPHDFHASLAWIADSLGLRLTALIRMMIAEHLPTYEQRAQEVRNREGG